MKPIDSAFVRGHAALFEDFWNRQLTAQPFELSYPAYGYEVHLHTNAREVLDAAQLSAPRYCRSATLEQNSRIELRVSLVTGWPATPVPSDLPACIQTVSLGDFFFQAATPWLQWFADLRSRVAYAFISPPLAIEPRLVSRYVLDRATNNVLLREDVGQLHATTLAEEGENCVLVLIAPHGTGKSTTAFHLLNAGFRLMGDGLLFIRDRDGQFELMGYPVGEAKLTAEISLDGTTSRDVPQSLFPQWRGEGDEVTVHNVRKSIVNLRELAPGKMIEHSVFPERVVVCLAGRNGEPHTRAERLTDQEAFERILPDTIYRDDPDAMARSLDVVRRLLARAACFRLTLGTDPQDLVQVIKGVVASTG